MKNCIILSCFAIFISFISGCTDEKKCSVESNNIRSYLIQKAAIISDSSLSGIQFAQGVAGYQKHQVQ